MGARTSKIVADRRFRNTRPLNCPVTGRYPGHCRGDRTQDRPRPSLHRRARPHAQRDALAALGVAAERIYVDHSPTGAKRERPGLREALAACRGEDNTVVAKLDRLARSVPDAHSIADELTACTGLSIARRGSILREP